MRVAAAKYLRDKRIIPAGRYLKTDTYGTGRTQERLRPDRTGEVPLVGKFERKSREGRNC